MTARLAPLALLLLAACTLGPTLQPRARILVLPTDISPVVQIQLDNVMYRGNAQPGELKGQEVRLASLDGAPLVCAFRTESWRRGGPGMCRDAAGRQYEMLVGEDPGR
jgi:hypothetical protein